MEGASIASFGWSIRARVREKDSYTPSVDTTDAPAATIVVCSREPRRSPGSTSWLAPSDSWSGTRRVLARNVLAVGDEAMLQRVDPQPRALREITAQRCRHLQSSRMRCLDDCANHCGGPTQYLEPVSAFVSPVSSPLGRVLWDSMILNAPGSFLGPVGTARRCASVVRGARPVDEPLMFSSLYAACSRRSSPSSAPAR